MPQELRRRYRHRLIKTLVRGERAEATLHRISAPLRDHHRRLRQQTLQAIVIEGRRHDQQLEIVTQSLLDVEQQGQRQIRLQAALVKLIEDHQPHARQLRIALDHARQDPLRDHLQAGLRPDAGFGAHAVTHGLPRLFAKQFSQPLRDITRRQAPRLEQDNASRDVALGEDLQRQPGRLPGAGRRVEQNLRRMLQGG